MSLYSMLRVGNNKTFLPFLVTVQRLSTCCAEPQHQWCAWCAPMVRTVYSLAKSLLYVAQKELFTSYAMVERKRVTSDDVGLTISFVLLAKTNNTLCVEEVSG